MIALAGLFGLAALVALVFRAATVALPLFLACTVGRLCLQAGSGPVAAIALGAVSGVVAHGLARGVFASARSDVTRSVLAIVLVTPAAFAGAEVAVALTRLGGMSGMGLVACGGVGALGTGFAALRGLAAAPVPVVRDPSFG